MDSDYRKRMAAQKADRLERQVERRAAHKEKEKLLYKELKNEYDAQHVKNMVDAHDPDGTEKTYMGNYVPSHQENSAALERNERSITRKAAGGRVGKSYRGYGSARHN